MTHTHWAKPPSQEDKWFPLNTCCGCGCSSSGSVCRLSDLWLGICCCKDFYHQGHRPKKCINKTCCCLNNSDITQCTRLIYAISPALEERMICNHHRWNACLTRSEVGSDFPKYGLTSSPVCVDVCVCVFYFLCGWPQKQSRRHSEKHSRYGKHSQELNKGCEEKAFHTSVTLCDCETPRLTSSPASLLPLVIVNMLFLVDAAG